MPKPATYKREYAKQAEKLCKQGATDFELGIAFGVSRRTIGYWASKYKEFGTALKVGKDIADDRVERTLYERATGYSYDAVKILQNNGQPVIVPYTEHVAPDTTACIFWLKNRRFLTWRDRMEHTGKDGAAITLTLSKDDAAL